MASKVYIMGDAESIKGFTAVGLSVVPCEPETAHETFRRLCDDGAAIIYMTEELYTRLDKDVARVRESATPAVIPLPGVRGNTGVGVARLRAAVEQAVGSDIIFNK